MPAKTLRVLPGSPPDLALREHGIGSCFADGVARSLLHPAAASAPEPTKLSVLDRGFRPFFLLAGLFAIWIVPLWVFVLSRGGVLPSYFDPVTFHAHEMLFGFTTAVLGGFLLTAVGNWTKRETATGGALLALVGLWLSGRLAMLFADRLPRGVTAALDLSFLPALIGTLAVPLWAARSRRNFAILGIVVALFAANVAAHLEALGVLSSGVARRANLAGLDLITLVMLVIAGRTFPMFTRNATGVASIRSLPVLDRVAVAAMLLVVVSGALAPGSTVAGLSLCGAGLLAAARSVHWGAWHSWRNPLLWVLHAGYAWLCLGLLLRGAAILGLPISGTAGTHAVTVGAIGGLTLGMMARVSLGHTGRLLAAPRPMALAFGIINLAAAVRCFGPIVSPGAYLDLLLASALLWATAFAIFVAVYTPILLRPRVDGRPG